MNCNDTNNAGSNAPTLTTLRKRQRQDGALWSGSISPNGKHIACVSPFKKGFWILTITPASSANNSTAPSSSFSPSISTTTATSTSTSTRHLTRPLQKCTSIRRPEVDRDDFLHTKRKAPLSFIKRVTWSNNATAQSNQTIQTNQTTQQMNPSILAVLIDDGRCRLFDSNCKSISRVRWFPPSEEASTGIHPELGKRAVDVVFVENGTTICILCQDCVLRRYDVTPCLVALQEQEEEEEEEEENEANGGGDGGDGDERIGLDVDEVTAYPMSRPIEMPDLHLNQYFSKIHRVVQVPESTNQLWIFGIGVNNTTNSGSSDGGSGGGSDDGSGSSCMGCWDLSKDLNDMMICKPIPIPTHGVHEEEDERAVGGGSVSSGMGMSREETEDKDESCWNKCGNRCCCHAPKAISLHPHTIRCVAVSSSPSPPSPLATSTQETKKEENIKLATVDMNGVVTIWSWNQDTKKQAEFQFILAARNFPDIQIGEESSINTNHQNNAIRTSTDIHSASTTATSSSASNTSSMSAELRLRKSRDRFASFVDTEEEDCISSSVLPLVTAVAFVRNGSQLLLLHDDGSTTFLNVATKTISKNYFNMKVFETKSFLCEKNIYLNGCKSSVAIITSKEKEQRDRSGSADSSGSISSLNSAGSVSSNAANQDSK